MVWSGTPKRAHPARSSGDHSPARGRRVPLPPRRGERNNLNNLARASADGALIGSSTAGPEPGNLGSRGEVPPRVRIQALDREMRMR